MMAFNGNRQNVVSFPVRPTDAEFVQIQQFHCPLAEGEGVDFEPGQPSDGLGSQGHAGKNRHERIASKLRKITEDVFQSGYEFGDIAVACRRFHARCQQMAVARQDDVEFPKVA